VQGSDVRHVQPPDDREVQVAGVEVDHVEPPGGCPHPFEQDEVAGHRVPIVGRRPVTCHQPGGRKRLSTGEQGYIMPTADEFLGQMRDNPLRPPVPGGRDRLEQGRDLGHPHLQRPPLRAGHHWP
jgi:hypothetical protein